VKGLVIATVTTFGMFIGGHLATAVQAEEVMSNTPQSTFRSIDMSAIPTLTPDRVSKLQQALQQKGFDPGPIDGVLGPRTREAVRNFQEKYGISSTEIDNQTLYALGGVELASRPAG
jgi:peptidoglycan hydrolase-like protein with peptidoglycan-binding domain